MIFGERRGIYIYLLKHHLTFKIIIIKNLDTEQ